MPRVTAQERPAVEVVDRLEQRRHVERNLEALVVQFAPLREQQH